MSLLDPAGITFSFDDSQEKYRFIVWSSSSTGQAIHHSMCPAYVTIPDVALALFLAGAIVERSGETFIARPNEMGFEKVTKSATEILRWLADDRTPTVSQDIPMVSHMSDLLEEELGPAEVKSLDLLFWAWFDIIVRDDVAESVRGDLDLRSGLLPSAKVDKVIDSRLDEMVMMYHKWKEVLEKENAT